jgi:nicotinamide riboside kinase
MIKIGIIGPPGSGKTTLAAEIFVILKKENFHVEVVPELIKYKVYQGLNFKRHGFDTVNTWEQLELEEKVKKGQFDFLICEAPVCNGYFYASFYRKGEESLILRKIAEENINNYDIIIKVKHEEKSKYTQSGRKESFQKSLELSSYIYKEFESLKYNGLVIEYNRTNIKNILRNIKRLWRAL